MHTIELSSEVALLEVGLNESSNVALVLELCREFHLLVDQALRAKPVVGESGNLSLEYETAEGKKVTRPSLSNSQQDVLKRIRMNHWFSASGFSHVEREARFQQFLRRSGITLSNDHFCRGN
jgi:hypothetical protein